MAKRQHRPLVTPFKLPRGGVQAKHLSEAVRADISALTDAPYVTVDADPALTNARVFRVGAGLALVDHGAALEMHATPVAIGLTTYLITGGQIVWIDEYEFLISAATYFINGSVYHSEQGTVVLDPADATHDRIDVIAVNDAGTVVVVPGTAAAQPSEPDVNPGTQLKLGLVYVAAASTAPAGASDVVLYAENAGDPAEWDWTTSGSGLALNSTNNPRTGTATIEGTSVANGAYAQGEIGTGTIEPNDSLLLVLYLRSKATWHNNRGLSVTFRLNGTIVGGPVNIQRTGTWGFDSSQTSSYQVVAIPISAFSIPTGATANQIRIADFGGSIGFYLDDISLQGGTVQALVAKVGWFLDSGVARVNGQYYSPEHDAGNSGTDLEIDWNDGNTQLVTVTDDWAPTFANPRAGGRYLLVIDNTGAHAIALPAEVTWSGGEAADLSPAGIHVLALAYSAVSGGVYLAAANLDFS